MTVAHPRTLVLLALMILAALLPLARQAAEALGSLPLTMHAQTAHVGEKWDAAAIQEFIAGGGCPQTPQEYACADHEFRVVYCKLSPKMAIGLVIGLIDEIVITGFSASPRYWQNRCPAY